MLAVLLLGAAAARGQVTSAAFERVPCASLLPAGKVDGETVTCGTLAVPEKRSDPSDRTLRLAVAIFHPPGGATRPDPVVYLTGGPGGSQMKMLSQPGSTVAPWFEVAGERDVIFFDQRGVGSSEPALDCPAFTELYLDLYDLEVGGRVLTASERLDRKVEALSACAEHLRGIADLSAYNTLESAADVNDLIRALGYDRVNLWGGSYGTRLALEVMRQFPTSVRSVLLEAILPPDVDLYVSGPANFARSLDLLFEACARDEACRDAYPDLPAVLHEAVARLNAEPVETSVLDPVTRQRYAYAMSGDALLELLFRALYHTALRPELPKIIYDASEGHFDTILLAAREDILRQDLRSWGMYLSVLCHDAVPFSDRQAFEAALLDFPALRGFFDGFEVGGLAFRACDRWGAGRADASQNEPVTSDIPTLLFAGEADPITSAEWANRVAATLANGRALVLRGMGHDVGGACAHRIMRAFLENPTAATDVTCLDDLVEAAFVVRAPTVVVDLEPFTSEKLGLRSLRPVGWTEVGPGAFARRGSAADPAALIHDRVSLSAEAFQDVVAKQLGLATLPASTEGIDANGLEWRLYTAEVQGVSVDVALAESSGTTLVVVMQSPQIEREELYAGVFMPAVSAVSPLDR